MLHRDVAEGIHRVEDVFVNWYLVEDGDSVTVVDTGHPTSWGRLQRALAELGRSPGDVAAVVLTHGHADHVGFAERARTKLGVDVWVHADETRQAAHPQSYEHERSPLPYLARRPWLLGMVARSVAAGVALTKGVQAPRTHDGEGTLDVPGRPQLVFTPGHTRGHCSLHFPDRGALIAGDALLTVDPYTRALGPQLPSRASTADSAQALASLDAIAGTGAEVVLPGHGNPWRGGAAQAANQARERGPS